MGNRNSSHLVQTCRQTGSAVSWPITFGVVDRQLLCETKRLLLDVDHFFYFFYTLTGTTANRLAPKKNKKMTLDEKTCVRQLFRPGIICVMHNEISWRPELQTNTFRMPGFRTRTNKAKSKCRKAAKSCCEGSWGARWARLSYGLGSSLRWVDRRPVVFSDVTLRCHLAGAQKAVVATIKSKQVKVSYVTIILTR